MNNNDNEMREFMEEGCVGKFRLQASREEGSNELVLRTLIFACGVVQY